MPIVAIYQFEASFLLKPELQQSSGQERVTHEGLLLLRQDTPTRSDEAAIAELTNRYWTIDSSVAGFGVMDERTLDMPDVVQYAPLYRLALETGSALSVSDPSAYAERPDPVPQDGFRPATPR